MDPKIIDRNHIHPLLAKRWSPRTFSDEPVEMEKLQRIFEAGRWAPSSSNEQPWWAMLGIKEGMKPGRRFSNILNENNQSWCFQALVLVLTCSKKHFAK